MSSVPHDHIDEAVVERAPLTRQTTNPTLDHVRESSANPIRVAVVGGGIGGLAVAIGLLARSDIDVQVYEAAHKFAEIGAGVAVGPNAQRAMEMIGPHAAQAYLSQATHNMSESDRYTWCRYMVGKGKKAGEFIAVSTNETGQSTVHRAHFLDEFASLVPVERAHFGKRLVKLEDKTEEGGAITLHFKDGTTAEADAVIGADGVHSYAREFVLGKDDLALLPQYTGTVAYRGLIPMDKAVESLGEEYSGNTFMWCGSGGMIMNYPIDFGHTMNVVAITYNHKTWTDSHWVVPVATEKVIKDFEGWGEHCSKLLALLDKPSAWSMWDHPPAARYNKGRVCIMGDAAHASTPYQGQGAGQAIEDALVIETLLGLVKDARDIKYAFQAYNDIRKPRSQKNVVASRESGLTVSFQRPGMGDDIEKVAQDVTTRMNWLWDIDLEKQNNEAIERFKKLAGIEP